MAQTEYKIGQEKLTQLVVFHVRDEEFGVPIEEIQEIIKAGNITPVPDAPNFIKGIINVRGDIVTTIDMRTRFALGETKNELSRHIIITKQNENLFGLMVDEVTEVLRISDKDIKPPPALITQVEKDYVNGVVIYGGRLVILLDLSKVLSPREFARLSDTAKKYQENADRHAESIKALESKKDSKKTSANEPENEVTRK